MKRIVFILLCLAFAKAESQQAPTPKDPNLHLQKPLTHKIDYGFVNPVVRTEEVHYKADDKGYEPTMLQVYTFTEGGNITNDYLQILGKYKSETLKEYKYKEGALDSLITTASASSFNSYHNFKTNQKGHVLKETVSGKYTNYTQEYIYDKIGNVIKIVLKHKTGSVKTAEYFYQNDQLDYVIETTQDKNKEEETRLIYYKDGAPFMSAMKDDDRAVVYDTNYGTFSIALESKNISKEIVKLRKTAQNNEKAWAEKINNLYNSDYIIDKDMDAVNEKGDWIKRYSVVNRGVGDENTFQKRYVFRKLYYQDGTTSGSTDFDLLFQMRVPRKN